MSFLLVTRNEKNFDEIGRESTFATRTEAINAADRFIAQATCNGAEAHVFFRGFTEAEITKHNRKIRCVECGWLTCQHVNGMCAKA